MFFVRPVGAPDVLRALRRVILDLVGPVAAAGCPTSRRASLGLWSWPGGQPPRWRWATMREAQRQGSS
jgi:hypothetical protein